jgi:hypothetical protein
MSEIVFKPTCPHCQEKNPHDREICLYCGSNMKSQTNKRKARGGRYGCKDPLVIRSSELAEFLEPLIEVESADVLALQFNTCSTAIHRALYKQTYVSLSTVDRWLTNAGLSYALSDGTLTAIANPDWTQEQFQRYFLRCGDNPPSDVISEWDEVGA